MEPSELLNFTLEENKLMALIDLNLYYFERAELKNPALEEAKEQLKKAMEILENVYDKINSQYYVILLVDKYSNYKIGEDTFKTRIAELEN